MSPSYNGNAELIRLQKYGFWIGTKQSPRRAVRWEAQTSPEGRQKFRGRNWVEVLEHGVSREPERFFGADVEAVGPHELLAYYPAVDEPVCGWMSEPGKYCPRPREVTDGAIQPFCRRHESELQGEESNAGEDSSHAE